MKPDNVKKSDWYHYNVLFSMEHILGYKRFQKYLGPHQKKLFTKIDKYLSGNSNGGKMKEVEEVAHNITREDFVKLCYDPGLPRVFRQAAGKWEAIKKWNLDFFEDRYGHQEVTLNDNVGLGSQQYEVLSFKEYIKQFRSGSLKYLRFANIVNHNQELKNDFDMAWLRKFNLPFSWGEDTKMFVGAKGTLTPLHVGFSDFLFVQVMGRKKWILYPTNNRLFLDVRTERTLHFYSNASPYRNDDPNFPLLKYAQPYEVYLEPGDILWVPSMVWHQVENLSDSIGIRCGRSSIFSAFKSSKMLTTLVFLATKPNIIAHSISTRTKKRDLNFSKSWEELNQPILDKINPFKKKNKLLSS